MWDIFKLKKQESLQEVFFFGTAGGKFLRVMMQRKFTQTVQQQF